MVSWGAHWHKRGTHGRDDRQEGEGSIEEGKEGGKEMGRDRLTMVLSTLPLGGTVCPEDATVTTQITIINSP